MSTHNVGHRVSSQSWKSSMLMACVHFSFRDISVSCSTFSLATDFVFIFVFMLVASLVAYFVDQFTENDPVTTSQEDVLTLHIVRLVTCWCAELVVMVWSLAKDSGSVVGATTGRVHRPLRGSLEHGRHLSRFWCVLKNLQVDRMVHSPILRHHS